MILHYIVWYYINKVYFLKAPSFVISSLLWLKVQSIACGWSMYIEWVCKVCLYPILTASTRALHGCEFLVVKSVLRLPFLSYFCWNIYSLYTHIVDVNLKLLAIKATW